MKLLLLTDIDGVGRKHELVVVSDKYALDSLLPQSKALIATPTILRRYAGVITNLAEHTAENDAFISHASEDKDEVVRPLVDALVHAGHKIWYDEFSLTVGDSLRASIDRGLAKSRFAVVVVSPHFFAKRWTEYELNGLVAKELCGQKAILPVWHKVSKDEVLKFSPSLADKFALNTAMFTIAELAIKVSQAMKGA